LASIPPFAVRQLSPSLDRPAEGGTSTALGHCRTSGGKLRGSIRSGGVVQGVRTKTNSPIRPEVAAAGDRCPQRRIANRFRYGVTRTVGERDVEMGRCRSPQQPAVIFQDFAERRQWSIRVVHEIGGLRPRYAEASLGNQDRV